MELVQKLGTRLNKTGKSYSSWGLFLCSYCNREVEKRLKCGKKSRSCGCMKDRFIGEANTKHGGTKKGSDRKLYKMWNHMFGRCYDPRDKSYKNYGGRGIRVCDEWADYNKFKDWSLLNGYRNQKDLEIDRENNDGNYEPSNCRFVSKLENIRNRGYNILNMEKAEEIRKKYRTGEHTQRGLAHIYGVTQTNIYYVVNNIRWIQ